MQQQMNSAVQQFLNQNRQQNPAGNQLPETLMGQYASKAVEKVREISNSPGAAPLHAFVRQGADEIAQVLKAFPDSITPQPEMGQVFEPTPQLVTENITGRAVNNDIDRLAQIAPQRTPSQQQQQQQHVR